MAFLYLLTSGLAFFIGSAMILTGLLLRLTPRPRLARIASRLLVLLGMIIVAISATPLPYWFYALWAAATLLALFARNARASALAVLACLIAVTWEFTWQIPPTIPLAPSTTIHVIGDSISAGIGETTRWPDLLSKLKNTPVINHARPGATASDALSQASELSPGPATVILEIGGNDLLITADAAAFARDLESLLRQLSTPQRTLIMLELPLPPTRNSFGLIQRRLAQQYHVALIPRRLFAKILCTEGNTQDGLHLSQSGHQHLAESLARLLATSN